jgi:DNA repair protein RadD
MGVQELRDYQEDAIARVVEAWKQGARSVFMISPTGSGKTPAFTYLVSQVVNGGGRALILVHRRELATQACNRLTEFGIDYGLIMSGEPSKPYARTQVATVQTLSRRAMPPAGLVIADEAHLSTAKTWTDILRQYPKARILGVSATPYRLSGRPLIGEYDASVVVATPSELRERGYLCNYVGFSYLAPDLSDIKTTGGDFNEQQSAAAMSSGVIVDNIVEQWLQHSSHLSTVVFAVTVDHSKQLQARFKAAGVAAEHLDGTTSNFERRAILKRVEDGQTKVLCNVGVAVEGLDIPRLKCCVLARPTMSLARAIQMMGRVRRPWQGQVARIHDHAFNIARHGLPDTDRDYTLNAKKERPPSLTTCAECLALYSGSHCPACSHVNPVKEQAERKLNTIEDAEQFDFSSDEESATPKAPVEIKWNDIGRMIEGVFQSVSDEQTEYGMQKRYLVRGDKRDYKLPGTARLNAAMKKVAVGSKVRVTYTGNQDLPGGKHAKQFKVEVDDELEDLMSAEKYRASIREAEVLMDTWRTG